MKIQFVFASVLLLVQGAATSAQEPKPQPSCRSGSAEAEAPSIERTIRSWYAAESENNLDGWHAQLLPDFYLFDEGIRRSGDALFQIVGPRNQRTRQQIPDLTITLDFRDLHVHVDCNAALATYTLHAVADSQKQQKHRENIYLESSWLRKEDGQWRIGFSQTTRISEPAPSLPPSDAVQPPAIPSTPTADAMPILETLRALHAAEGDGDATQFHEQIMPDFYSFDEGQRYTGDGLLKASQKHLADGSKVAWKVSNSELSIDRELALATFTTSASFNHAGQEQKLTFLESAVLRRVDGRWRIAFLHRTLQPASKLDSH